MDEKVNKKTSRPRSTRSDPGSSSHWRTHFFRLSGMLLLFAGLVTIIICSFSHFTWSSHEEQNSTVEDHESKWWLVLGVGLVFLCVGSALLLGSCWISTGQNGPRTTSSTLTTQPTQKALEKEQEQHSCPTGFKDERTRSNLIRPKEVEMDSPPPHLAHYKPRQFNQHGYGTRHAPIAAIEELDYSLRSSMNSLWSQHVHQQMNQSSTESEDGSFQSVVMP